MTNERIAIKTAKRLVDYLASKGIKTETDLKYRKISDTLRGSWYVDKVKQCGYTDCIHIDVECGGFFAILNTGEIMTGQNVMINDAISNVIYELLGTPDYDAFWTLNIYAEEDWGEDALLIGSLSQIKELIEKCTKN